MKICSVFVKKIIVKKDVKHVNIFWNGFVKLANVVEVFVF